MLKKLHLFFIIFIVFSQNAFADSKVSLRVGPGVIHHHEFRQKGPFHLHILEIDLSCEWINIETVKAKNKLYGYKKTSSMAARKDFEQHRVVGAINGDFFRSGGIPVGAQVINGMLLKGPTTRSIFAFTKLGKPLIDIVSFQGTLSTTKNSSVKINGINRARNTNELDLYNKYFGSTTATNYWGTEIIVENINDQFAINEIFKIRIMSKDSIAATGHGNNSIPVNGVVLSGHGSAQKFLNKNVFVGDTLSVLFQLHPRSESITELIGGIPRLIRDGIVTVEWDKEGTNQNFANNCHPRTAVGISQDAGKLYFFVVDGRQPGYSVGMSLYELADYMLEWGVYQGVNLDGGGSTTMVVRNRVVNKPSDATGERTVANALMVISTAPISELSTLEISPNKIFMLAKNQLQFSVSGFDKYYNSVEINSDSLYWNCSNTIGSIDQNGLFTAGKIQDKGFVFVTKGNVRDSTLVHISNVNSIE